MSSPTRKSPTKSSYSHGAGSGKKVGMALLQTMMPKKKDDASAAAGAGTGEGSVVQSTCLQLLTDGHVNSFIDFFYLTHELKVSPGELKAMKEVFACATSPDSAALPATPGTPTGATVPAQIAGPGAMPRPGSSISNAATAGAGAGIAVAPGSPAGTPSLQVGQGGTPLPSIASPSGAHRGPGAAKSARKVLPRLRAYNEKPLLPEDERERVMYLEEHDSDGRRNLYTLTTINKLRELLTSREEAQRQGNREAIYESKRNLAKYFQSLQNYSIATEYFKDALELAKASKNIDVEANFNIGSVCEDHGNLDDALRHYEESRNTAKESKDTDGEKLASKAIVRVRIKIGGQLEEEGRHQDAIQHYIKCVDILKQSYSDDALVGEIHYRLGRVYSHLNDIPKAIQYLETYLSYCKATNDHTKEGLAQVSLAACHENSGNPDLAISQLKHFIEQSGSSISTAAAGAHDATVSVVDSDSSTVAYRYAQAEACNQLGMLYNRIGHFSAAVEYLEKHYRIIVELERERAAGFAGQNGPVATAAEGTAGAASGTKSAELAKLHLDVAGARVQLGIARANNNMGEVYKWLAQSECTVNPRSSNLITSKSLRMPAGMQALLKWKAERIVTESLSGASADGVPELNGVVGGFGHANAGESHLTA